ncbi:MAG: dienelactone hydrolase family protein [bacterium]
MTSQLYKHGRTTLIILLLISVTLFTFVGPSHAEIVTKNLTYHHNGTELEGYLAYDDELDQPRPGVLIVHQWMGLGDYEKRRARQLAEIGYTAFAADVYGSDTRPTTTHEASLASSTFRKNRSLYRKRLRVSLNTMRSLEQTDPDNLAAIGYCFGGTGVLELARSGAPIEAAVSFHGGLENPHPEDAGNITARIQVHHGAKDPHVTQDHVLSFWNEMNKYASVDWDLNVYSDAPHGFTESGSDAYNKRADRLSWKRMSRLFEDVFPRD